MAGNKDGAFDIALRNSSMRACKHCLMKRNQITDYDVSEMTKTKQGWVCNRCLKVWLERRKAASFRSGSTMIKAIAK